MYGRQTETAVAAMSRLAEAYGSSSGAAMARLSSHDIARDRNLPQPSVAKVLTVLSQAGLVVGSPGPRGGYALARHPRDIVIYDVFRLFERDDDDRNCPYGGVECGIGEPCPLHDKLVRVREAMERLLHETTFDQFRLDEQKRRREAAARARDADRPSKRRSYRATKPRRRSKEQ